MNKLYIYILIFALTNVSHLFADTVYWSSRNTEPSFLVDISPDWDKDYITRDNGVIFNARRMGSSIEVRSFTVNEIKSMQQLISMKAARLSAKFSYIFLVRDKEYISGKREILWKLKYDKQSYIERTVIIRKETGVIILSCLALEKEYPKVRVIFENAILSIQIAKEGLRFDDNQIVFPLTKDQRIKRKSDKEETVEPEEKILEEIEPEEEKKSNPGSIIHKSTDKDSATSGGKLNFNPINVE